MVYKSWVNVIITFGNGVEKIGKEIITFGNAEIEKQKFCCKNLISLKDVDIDNLFISKTSCGEKK